MSAAELPTYLLLMASVVAFLAAYMYQLVWGAGNGSLSQRRSCELILRMDKVPAEKSATELERELRFIIAAHPDLQGQLDSVVVRSLVPRDDTYARAILTVGTLLPEDQLLACLQRASKEFPYHIDYTSCGIQPLGKDASGVNCEYTTNTGLTTVPGKRLVPLAANNSGTASSAVDQYRDRLWYMGINGRSRGPEDSSEQGTCHWLLGTEEYKSWVSSNGHKVLVLEGPPGSGKSILMKHMLEYTQVEESKFQVSLGFFFDSNSTDAPALAKTPLGLYRTLLHQLIDKMLSSTRLLQLLEREMPRSMSWDPRHLSTLKAVILKIFQGSMFERASIFIDAHDECHSIDASESPGGKGRFDILEFMAKLLREPGVDTNLCFSTRVADTLGQHLGPFYRVDMQKHNEADIERYIELNLKDVKLPGKSTTKDRDRLVQALLRQSSHIFLWAKLIVAYLKDERTERDITNVDELIRSFPGSFDELSTMYEALIERIHWRIRSSAYCDETHESRRKKALRLFQVIHVSIRPVSIDCARAILSCGNRSMESLTPENIRTISGRLVEVRDYRLRAPSSCATGSGPTTQILQFTHKSVREFFDCGGAKFLDSDSNIPPVPRSHISIARICMNVLDSTEQEPQERGASELFRYAAQFWTLHVRKGEDAIDELGDLPKTLKSCTRQTHDRFIERFKNCVNSNPAHQTYTNMDDVPSLRILGDKPETKKGLLVFLAFEGCGKLAQQHSRGCRKCTKEQSIFQEAFLLAIRRGWANTLGEIQQCAERCGMPVDPDDAADPEEETMTPLSLACEIGKVKVVGELLRMKANILGTPAARPLHVAITGNYKQIVSDILSFYCSEEHKVFELLGCKNDSDATSLHVAALFGCQGIVEELLNYLDNQDIGKTRALLSCENDDGYTAIHEAVLRGDPEIMEKFQYFLDEQGMEDLLKARSRRGRGRLTSRWNSWIRQSRKEFDDVA
ncbi:hypothetical protein PG989_016475 [Apiospora arundinis]